MEAGLHWHLSSDGQVRRHEPLKEYRRPTTKVCNWQRVNVFTVRDGRGYVCERFLGVALPSAHNRSQFHTPHGLANAPADL